MFEKVTKSAPIGVTEIAVHPEGNSGNKSFDYLLSPHFYELVNRSIALINPEEWGKMRNNAALS